METVDKPVINKAEFYAKHIKDWQQSGMAQEKYCKSVNISYAAFVYWWVKLRPKNKENINSKFIPLVSSAHAVVEGSESQKIEVIIPDGIRLSFPLSTDPMMLGDYIKALRMNP
jgi:hypothetical protein